MFVVLESARTTPEPKDANAPGLCVSTLLTNMSSFCSNFYS